jgi:hypothetical protein
MLHHGAPLREVHTCSVEAKPAKLLLFGKVPQQLHGFGATITTNDQSMAKCVF